MAPLQQNDLEQPHPPGRLRFGTAVRPEQLFGAAPLASAIRECDLLVPEYHGQWSAVEWRRGDPWFGNYDAIVAFAALNNQTVRGHSLIWEQMTPEWARQEMRQQRDWRTIERHFGNLVGRYRGKIAEWVVVNEMIDTEHGRQDIRRNSFQRAFGNGYVAQALHTAHAIDPSARLMINDYALYHENPTDEARRKALLKLVEKLKAEDVPLDIVGIQGHLEIVKGPVPQKRFARFLRDLADTGVELALTELDVLEDDRSLPVDQRDARVADMVQGLLDVACSEPAMRSITTWGLSDRDSWLQEKCEDTKVAMQEASVDNCKLNRGLPFDGGMAAKLMRKTIALNMPQSRFAANA
ncbi:endo-1,4-beta-xylanase [Novosphingobium sp. NBM11]|uniref:endo-1,4-beta-xylanase n=1 Tax=Novosphingobium sp. NBM11 TaxID=2596914 RepID=UPI001892350F|nr:endo-1,4-beta-xylanase [Novosphingobium sp. NBM11]MBF5091546.1 endo-1,4-beta-xylanase [Novosphingobium sp. NBM11]